MNTLIKVKLLSCRAVEICDSLIEAATPAAISPSAVVNLTLLTTPSSDANMRGKIVRSERPSDERKLNKKFNQAFL